jgi:OOP family OmpA-OmpF porin
MKKIILIVFILVVGFSLYANGNKEEVFGSPENLGLNTPARENAPCISTDGLSLYFHSDRLGGQGDKDIWVAKRRTVSDAWQQPINLGSTVNTSANEFGPHLSPDGLELYFSSDRSGGYGFYDLWVTTRASVDAEWGTPANIGNDVNSSAAETAPCISMDGLELYFSDHMDSVPRTGGLGSADLWVASRPNTWSAWGKPVNLGSVVNSVKAEVNPTLSADGLILFFGSTRGGGQGGRDVWVTTRQTLDGEWCVPRNLGPSVNSEYSETRACMSPDGTMLYFNSNRIGGMGGYDLWQIPILSREAFAKAYESR